MTTTYAIYMKRTKGSIYGVLTFQRVVDGVKDVLFERLPIASGQYGYLNGGDQDWITAKSPTPIGKHWLSTKREALQMEPKGTPFYVLSSIPGERTIKGPRGVRRDCGAHFENHNPGSVGCPVLLHDTEKREQDTWAFFEALDALYKQGIKFVEFNVFF